MDEAQSLAQAIDEPVSLSTYDPAWPSSFEVERRRLAATCNGQLIAIEHIGSTAIPGMAAKPVIDILEGVSCIAIADSLMERLCNSGYVTSAEFNAAIGDRRWLMRWDNGHRTHHLHLVVYEGAEWCERLVFRDALRANAELASRYLNVKTDLAAKYRTAREAYTDAKSEFVREVLERHAS